jgi:hypothetical protein
MTSALLRPLPSSWARAVVSVLARGVGVHEKAVSKRSNATDSVSGAGLGTTVADDQEHRPNEPCKGPLDPSRAMFLVRSVPHPLGHIPMALGSCLLLKFTERVVVYAATALMTCGLLRQS